MKALAIVELPDCCYHCKFNITDEDMQDCYLCHKKFNKDEQMVRQEWCPLKPIPQRKKVGEIEKIDDFMKSDIQTINEKVTAKIMLDTELLIASGYNLCIDKILGETE